MDAERKDMTPVWVAVGLLTALILSLTIMVLGCAGYLAWVYVRTAPERDRLEQLHRRGY